MLIQKKAIYLFRFFLDIAVVIFTFLLSNFLSEPFLKLTLTLNSLILMTILLFAWLISLTIIKIYDEYLSRDFIFELTSLLKMTYIQTLTAVLTLFFMKEVQLSRAFVIYYTLSLAVLLIIEKYTLKKSLIYLRLKGHNILHVLVVGAGNVGMKFYNTVIKIPHFGYKLVGFLDDNPINDIDGLYLGKLNDLDQVLSNRTVDNVIIALPNNAEYKVEEIINTCEKHTTRIKIIPDYSKFIHSKFEVGLFANFPIISVGNNRMDEIYWRILKRLLDIGITIILTFTVFIWLWPILAILIKYSSRGPILYKQKRLGRNSREFTIYKFRSLYESYYKAGHETKFKQVCPNDSRVTKIGKFLRKTNLDELPQFINVLKGEMSVVGPRPHPLDLNNESKKIVNRYMVRHYVKPGVTGWAQINGLRGETKTVEAMQKRIDHDIWYIDNWFFGLDLQIIMKTAALMLKGDPHAY